MKPPKLRFTLFSDFTENKRPVWVVDTTVKIYLPTRAGISGQVIIKEGFRTDFASVPRLPLMWYVAGGVGIKASLVHDYLYSGGLIHYYDNGLLLSRGVTKKEADNIYYHFLLDSKVLHIRALLMWLAVRLFGRVK
jgi:hypothetical protein